MQSCAMQNGQLMCGGTAAQTEQGENERQLSSHSGSSHLNCDHASKDTTFPVLGWGLIFCFVLGFFTFY